MTLEEQIARLAHRGQVDKAGRPYIEHVERVALHAPYNCRGVAWLHDVVEDCGDVFSLRALGVLGVSRPVVLAVATLTRLPNVSYEDYIAEIEESGDEMALAVKILDLRDHLETTGCPESLRPRYEKALALLTAARARQMREGA